MTTAKRQRVTADTAAQKADTVPAKRSRKQKSRSKLDPHTLERNRLIWERHKAGVSMREIGREIGVSKQRVHVIIDEFRKELIAETYSDALDSRATITARLDVLLKACYPKAAEGDLQAVDRVLRIEAQRAKLWGADVVAEPTVEVSQEGSEDSADKPAIVVKFRMGGQAK